MNFVVSSQKMIDVLQNLTLKFNDNYYCILEDCLFDIGERKYKISNLQVESDIMEIYLEAFKNKNPKAATVTELVWCYIVRKLQKGNFDLEAIKKIRSSLSVKTKKGTADLYLLEFILTYIVKMNKSVCMNVYENGDIKIIDLSNDEVIFDSNIDDDSYIQLLLDRLLSKVDKGFILKKTDRKRTEVNLKEDKLLRMLRMNNSIIGINLKTKNGDLLTADIVEAIPLNNKKIKDLLNERNYQTLSIKREAGKDCYMQRNYREFFR